MLSERELAFIAIHKDSYPSIFRFVCRRVESVEVAEEIAADVFPRRMAKMDRRFQPGPPVPLDGCTELGGKCVQESRQAPGVAGKAADDGGPTVW